MEGIGHGRCRPGSVYHKSPKSSKTGSAPIHGLPLRSLEMAPAVSYRQ
jgi:hypothetical protein